MLHLWTNIIADESTHGSRIVLILFHILSASDKTVKVWNFNYNREEGKF